MIAPYRLVFDIADRWPGPSPAFLIPLAMAAFGAFLVFAPNAAALVFRGGLKGPARRVFGWLFFLFAASLTVIFFTQSIVETRQLQAARRTNPPVVEGCLTAFHPMPATGHDMERIWVQGRCFAYSDYVTTPAFANAASHGGPIHADSRVRASYAGGAILRLEVADHACPAAPDPGRAVGCGDAP